MLSSIKLLKIVLPVATVTTATVLTTSLISFGKSDLDKKKEDKDKEISDFIKPSENFEEKTLFYSKDGDADKLKTVDKEKAEQIKKLMKESDGKLTQGEKLGDTVQKQQSEIKSGNHEGQSSSVEKPDSLETTSREGNKNDNKEHDENESDNVSKAKDISLDSSGSIDINLSGDQDQIKQSLGEGNGDNSEPDVNVLKSEANKQGQLEEVKDSMEKNEGTRDPKSSQILEQQPSGEESNSEATKNTMGYEEGDEKSGKGAKDKTDDSSRRADISENLVDSNNLNSDDRGQVTDGHSDRYSDEAIKRLEQMQGELFEFENKLRQLIS